MKDPVEARVKSHIREKRVNDLYRCSFVYENDTKDDHTGFEQMKGLLDKLMHIEHEATIKQSKQFQHFNVTPPYAVNIFHRELSILVGRRARWTAS